MAGSLVEQANSQQSSGLDEGRKLKLRQQGREAGWQVQEEHLGDGGITAAPLCSCHA